MCADTTFRDTILRICRSEHQSTPAAVDSASVRLKENNTCDTKVQSSVQTQSQVKETLL